jgi:outer membrane cobalamin receptor
MYYLNYGTSDLKPERSLSYSITFEYSKSIFNAEISGFMIDTDDQIVAIPKSPLVWSARNMASVLSRGIEFNAVIDVVDNFLILKMNYTIQRVTDNERASETYKKLVQYVPQELASADVSLKHSGFLLNAACRYTGFAFALPDNSYESLINSFWLFDINLNKRIELSGTEINFKLGILNIFDTRYSVVKNYPMPGRIIRIGIDFKL